jgi:hypothetical protein
LESDPHKRLPSLHADLAKRLQELEEKTERLELSHDTFSRNTRVQLKQVFEALRELMTPPEPPKRPIGFVTPEERKKDKPAGKKREAFFLLAVDRAAARKLGFFRNWNLTLH